MQVAVPAQRLHHVLDDRLGGLDQPLPLVRVALHDLIRVEVVGHGGHAQVGLQARLVAEQSARIEAQFALAIHRRARRIQPAQHGFLPGGIRVERQHDLARERLSRRSWSSVSAVPIGETTFS